MDRVALLPLCGVSVCLSGWRALCVADRVLAGQTSGMAFHPSGCDHCSIRGASQAAEAEHVEADHAVAEHVAAPHPHFKGTPEGNRRDAIPASSTHSRAVPAVAASVASLTLKRLARLPRVWQRVRAVKRELSALVKVAVKEDREWEAAALAAAAVVVAAVGAVGAGQCEESVTVDEAARVDTAGK